MAIVNSKDPTAVADEVRFPGHYDNGLLSQCECADDLDFFVLRQRTAAVYTALAFAPDAAKDSLDFALVAFDNVDVAG